MKRRLRQENGWVVVTAVWVMTLMIGLGFALLAIVDEQSKQSGLERVRESSFNMTEGSLYGEAVALQNNWPTQPPDAAGTTCDPANPGRGCAYGRYATVAASQGSPCSYSNGTLTGPTSQCPPKEEIEKVFNNVDAATGALWQVQVRDNRDSAGNISTIYNRADVDALACKDTANVSVVCTWDANRDRRLWVRATATVKGKTRRMVALLRLERQRIPFPTNAVTAQSLNVTNNGQDIVNGSGSQVVLRCGFTPTTTTSALASGTQSVTVAAPSTGPILANEGISIDTGANQEFLDIASATQAGSTYTITFTAKAKKDHASGVPFVLAPNTLSSNPCNQWDASKNQVAADQTITASGAPQAMTDDFFDNVVLKDPTTTVYQTCPNNNTATANTWAGTVVVMNSGTADPTSGGSGACTINLSSGAPINGPLGGGNPTTCTNYGMIIVQSGTLRLEGNQVFCGIIYMRNKQTSTGPVFATAASAQVIGAIDVDGTGGVVVGSGCGSCGGSVIYDPNAGQSAGVAGTAGLVQNTWRELAPNQ